MASSMLLKIPVTLITIKERSLIVLIIVKTFTPLLDMDLVKQHWIAIQYSWLNCIESSAVCIIGFLCAPNPKIVFYIVFAFYG